MYEDDLWSCTRGTEKGNPHTTASPELQGPVEFCSGVYKSPLFSRNN